MLQFLFVSLNQEIFYIPVEPNHRFQFASYFGDNMVLQRAPQRAVIWGYGSASTENSTVTVTIKGQDFSKTYSAMIKNTGDSLISVEQWSDIIFVVYFEYV